MSGTTPAAPAFTMLGSADAAACEGDSCVVSFTEAEPDAEVGS